VTRGAKAVIAVGPRATTDGQAKESWRARDGCTPGGPPPTTNDAGRLLDGVLPGRAVGSAFGRSPVPGVVAIEIPAQQRRGAIRWRGLGLSRHRPTGTSCTNSNVVVGGSALNQGPKTREGGRDRGRRRVRRR